MKKAKVAIIGPGNIGMDLMYKVLRNPNLEMSILVGQDVDSPRLQIAADLGIRTSSAGIQAIIDDPDCCDIVFDATTAAVHKMHAPILKQLGKKAIDMTPAGVGALVVPAFNLEENLDADNINLISCSGQAVIPIIGAISRLVPVEYAEAVNAISSKSVQANVDEYTHHTGDAIRSVGGAKTSKALIVINPADPPIKMHNTIYCVLERLDEQLAAKIDKAVHDIVAEIQSYVPGYNMTTPPQFDYERRMVTTMVEIEGAGDYLPKYSGNLDIITQAGVRVAARMAEQM